MPHVLATHLRGLSSVLLLLGACATTPAEPALAPSSLDTALPPTERSRQTSRPTSAPTATEHRTRWPTVGVNVGGALLGGFDTTVRLDSATLGRGTEVSFEDDLGMGQSDDVVRVTPTGGSPGTTVSTSATSTSRAPARARSTGRSISAKRCFPQRDGSTTSSRPRILKGAVPVHTLPAGHVGGRRCRWGMHGCPSGPALSVNDRTVSE